MMIGPLLLELKQRHICSSGGTGNGIGDGSEAILFFTYSNCSRQTLLSSLCFSRYSASENPFGFFLFVVQRKCNLYHRTCSYIGRNVTSKVSCSQLELEDDVDDEACELVNGTELILGEGTDSFHSYLFRAVKNNNGTGVLLLSDVYGFEDSSTRDFAYRIACNGYNVLVPDLFRGNPWIKDRPQTDFQSWIVQQPPERVAKDIAASAKWMVDEFVAAGISKKLGIIGFCYGGGRLIETIARDKDAYFGIAVCFYGSRMDTSLATDIKIPVLFIAGDDDPLCPIDVLRHMEKSIRGSKAMIYYDRRHGFAHRPESPEDDQDAEDAFNVMRNWLHDGLVL